MAAESEWLVASSASGAAWFRRCEGDRLFCLDVIRLGDREFGLAREDGIAELEHRGVSGGCNFRSLYSRFTLCFVVYVRP